MYIAATRIRAARYASGVDIGTEKPAIVVEPLEDPVPHLEPVPEPEREPPVPVPDRELIPA